MTDNHPTAADRMSDSGSSYETTEVPVPRFHARVRRDEGLSDGEVRSYRADGASFRGVDPEGGPRLRIPQGYLEGGSRRGASIDNEPVPPSYRARQSYRMETMEDDMMGYTTTSRRMGASFRAPAPGEEVEDTRSYREVLEDKHMMINQLFGMRPRVPLPTEESSQQSIIAAEHFSRLFNTLWLIICGWWLFGLYFIVGSIVSMFGSSGRPYAAYCKRARAYVLWPFGKFIILRNPLATSEESKTDSPNKSSSLLREKNRLSEMAADNADGGSGAGRMAWLIFATIFLAPFHFILGAAFFLSIYFIPMSRMNFFFGKEIYKKDIIYVDFDDEAPGANGEVVFCTYSTGELSYFGHSFFGINIVFVNLFFFVILSILLHYVFPHFGIEEPHYIVLFIMSTISIIPISYYIGMAIASLSVQTSFAAGAVLNASFGSFVELMLYFSAIRVGTLNDLVQASVTGTLLGMMLLLPGLAMIAGGIRFKQQRFNRAATGVSSVLLSISIVGAFTPTIFYSTYGSYILSCQGCEEVGDAYMPLLCSGCSWKTGDLTLDEIFVYAVKPLTMFCAVILPCGYLAGVFFTLKTHSHIYDEEPGAVDEGDAEGHGHGGHDSPGWSKGVSVTVLLVSAFLFGLISEELVHSLEPVLRLLDIPPRFAGLTFIALVTSTIEFLNAILFAYHNDLTLALEIANSYCVQVALIQMPALVFIAIGVNYYEPGNLAFTLVFPPLDLFAVIVGLMILNFTSAEGKANYFQGISLVLIYSLFIAAFYFVPSAGWGPDPHAHASGSGSDSGSIAGGGGHH